MDKLVRILFADDHPMIREGLRFILESQNTIIASIADAENGIDVLEQVKNAQFDVIILDIHMPGLDGISTARRLRKNKVSTPILFISAHEDTATINLAVNSGANGFVLKSCGPEELVKAIVTVKNGGVYYSNEINLALMGNMCNPRRKFGLENELTSREWQILRMFSNEATNEEIAQELSLSIRTIEGHRRNIKRKLNVKSTIGMVRFAFQHKHLFGE